eukprot:gene54018-43946_t
MALASALCAPQHAYPAAGAPLTPHVSRQRQARRQATAAVDAAAAADSAAGR